MSIARRPRGPGGPRRLQDGEPGLQSAGPDRRPGSRRPRRTLPQAPAGAGRPRGAPRSRSTRGSVGRPGTARFAPAGGGERPAGPRTPGARGEGCPRPEGASHRTRHPPVHPAIAVRPCLLRALDRPARPWPRLRLPRRHGAGGRHSTPPADPPHQARATCGTSQRPSPGWWKS